MSNHTALALHKIQSALNVKKSRYNKHGDYYYRNLEDIFEAVKPLLRDEKALLMLTDCVEQIGAHEYVRATAAIVSIEDGAEPITVTALARIGDSKMITDESQRTGSASTYARKYALHGLFCLDDAQDPDAQDPDAHEPKAVPPWELHAQEKAQTKSELSQAQIKKLYAVAKQAGEGAEAVKARVYQGFGCEIKQMTNAQLDKVLSFYASVQQASTAF